MQLSIDSLCENLSDLPSTPLLLRSPRRLRNSPTSTTHSLHLQRGFLVCGNLSSFTAPFHWCRSRPYSFFSVIYFFFCPTQVRGGVSCLLGSLTSSASVQWVFYRSSSTCRCISDVSVRRKVISASYSSAIFQTPSRCTYGERRITCPPILPC